MFVWLVLHAQGALQCRHIVTPEAGLLCGGVCLRKVSKRHGLLKNSVLVSSFDVVGFTMFDMPYFCSCEKQLQLLAMTYISVIYQLFF